MTWTVVGTIAIVLATIGLGVVADRRWGLLPRRHELREAARPRLVRPRHGPGEAPETALATAPSELARLRTAQRCATCRTAMAVAGEHRVTYDERELLVLRFACARCAATRSLYVRPLAD